MPLKALACPPSAPSYGEAHTFEHCILQCPHRCLSPYMIAALAYSNERNHHKGKYISVTSLAGCIRRLHAERTVDYAQDPKNVLFGYRGTVMHSVMEDASRWTGLNGKSLIDLGFLCETQVKVGFCFEHGAFAVPDGIDASDPETWGPLSCPSDPFTEATPDCEWFMLGGTLDGGTPLSYEDDGKTVLMDIEDLKTMKDYAVNKFIFGDDSATMHTHTKDEYYLQAQLYRYLGERAPIPPQLKALGVTRIKFVAARIQAFSMGEFPYMGAHYLARKHYRHEYSTWYIPPITFEPDAWVEAYIRDKAPAIYNSLLTEREKAPVCEPSSNKDGSHSWRCNYCPFYKTPICPNPEQEWKLMQQGTGPTEAFRIVSMEE